MAKRRKKRSLLISVVVAVFLFLAVVLIYKFVKDTTRVFRQSSFTLTSTGQPLLTGKLTRLSDDLGLLKKSEYDELNDVAPLSVYYSAGVYARGAYRGYERIIAVRDPEGPGSALVYILATKDRKTYVLHQDDETIKLFPETDWRNPYQYLDKKKITKTDALPSDHPDAIPLASSFTLYKTTILTENVPSGKKSKEGYEVYEYRIQTDTSSFEKLTYQSQTISLFGEVTKPVEIPKEWEEDARVQQQLRNKYVKGTTGVIVVDTIGLPITYTMTRPDAIGTYNTAYKTYLDRSKKYEDARVKFEKKEITDKDLPEYPLLPSLPNLRFKGSEIKGSAQFFDSYDIAVPYMCGTDVDLPLTQNIKDEEFTSIGSVFGRELFILKDPEHPFYKLAYRNKMGLSKEEFESINPGVKKVTLEEYVTKHPVLFFKDTWNRWVAVGEYDYKMIGGCGKPVLYFYPEKPTDIVVSFAKSVDVTYAIPTYANNWYIQADPDGTLTDLQSGKTDCTLIDPTKFGSEYAKSACELNQYPYIYWAGNRIGTEYPFNPHLGWIVGRSELYQFLTEKLDEVGFTQSEKTDFLSYWVPEMEKHETPYYHVRFLQTSDMNMFIPMNITPAPDRYYRLFLDWKPLTDTPAYSVAPQELDAIVRTGFTVVEWGGLKE